MSQTVEIPGLGIVEFPDSMKPAEIQAKAAELSRGAQPPASAAAPATGGGGLGSYGPANHPWVQANQAAARGETPPVDMTVPNIAAPMVLPTVGSAAGGALGGMLGPAGATGGAMLGSLAGEGINQLTGITEPSIPALVGATAAPPIGDLAARGVNAVARGIGRFLPGSGAALRELSAQELATMAARFRQQPSADELYGLVRQFNPPVAMTNLAAKAKDVLDEEKLVAAGLDLAGVGRTAKGLNQALTVPPAGMQAGEMPFDQAFVNLKRIGGKVRETRIEGGEEHGAWKAMFRAGMDDLDAAIAAGNPAMPAVQALKAARDAAKREFAAEDIATLFDPTKKGSVVSQRGDGFWTVDFRKALRELRQNEDLRRGLTADEYKRLLADVEAMAKVTPALPPNAGAAAGSRGTNIGIAVGTGIGANAGLLLGGPFGAAMGGVTGGAVGGALPFAIGKFLVSDTGRQLLMGVLSGTGGVITPSAARLFLTAAATSNPGREGVTQLSQPFTGR